MKIVRYLDNLVTALSRALNALIGGNPMETLSGRSYRERHAAWWQISLAVIDHLIFFWQEDHCKRAHFWEIKNGYKPA